MQIRASRISQSIALALSPDYPAPPALPSSLLRAISAFFHVFRLVLARYRPLDFLELRHDSWGIDEEAYLASFGDRRPRGSRTRVDGGKGKGKDVEGQLVPVGDLGYSGSTFFTTSNEKFLIKSLPRRFEHEFFTHDLFDPYVAHMKKHAESLLVRITDMVYTPYPTLGGIFGTAPTHHIIMENLLYGKGFAGEGWETYDLKPNDFFFPERDIAGGRLAPESVKERLVDEFPDKARVSAADKKALLEILARDTQLLADHNSVDYSLFMVRYPGPDRAGGRGEVPFVRSVSHPWRSGVDDVDGCWTYRMVVLDFFWAKHKFHAKAMTGLVGAFNLIANKGPMSITANPGEYRERFMKMVDTIVVAED